MSIEEFKGVEDDSSDDIDNPEKLEDLLEQIGEAEIELRENLSELPENLSRAETAVDEADSEGDAAESNPVLEKITDVYDKTMARLEGLRSSVLAGTLVGSLMSSEAAFAATERIGSSSRLAESGFQAFLITSAVMTVAVGLDALRKKLFNKTKNSRYGGHR